MTSANKKKTVNKNRTLSQSSLVIGLVRTMCYQCQQLVRWVIKQFCQLACHPFVFSNNTQRQKPRQSRQKPHQPKRQPKPKRCLKIRILKLQEFIWYCVTEDFESLSCYIFLHSQQALCPLLLQVQKHLLVSPKYFRPHQNVLDMSDPF